MSQVARDAGRILGDREIPFLDCPYVNETSQTSMEKRTKNGPDPLTIEDSKFKHIRSLKIFKVLRKARTGRNPKTEKTIKIKASNAVKFKPGKRLK